MANETLSIPPVLIRALKSLRTECFDDSEYGIAIDAWFSGNAALIEAAEKVHKDSEIALLESELTTLRNQLAEKDNELDRVKVCVVELTKGARMSSAILPSIIALKDRAEAAEAALAEKEAEITRLREELARIKGGTQ